MSAAKINARQIRMLHALRSKLRMSDEAYRAMLSAYGTDSSKRLSAADAAAVITALEKRAIAARVWTPYRRLLAGDGGRAVREGLRPVTRVTANHCLASNKQINLIDALWKQVSRAEDDDSRRRALDSFLHRRFNRGGLLMVEEELVPKIVRALEAMGATSP